MAMLPAMANAMWSGRLALNDPWVRCRWYPTVTPKPETVKNTANKARAVQPRPEPRARGPAASTARNGTITNAYSAICSPLFLVPSTTGLGWAVTGPASVVVSAGGVDSTMVMGDHLSHSSYATVTYGAVASQGDVLVAAYPASVGGRNAPPSATALSRPSD